MATIRTYPVCFRPASANALGWIFGDDREAGFVSAAELSDEDVLALSPDDQKAALAEIGCQIVDGKVVALPACPDCGGEGGGYVDTEEGCVELACVGCGGEGVRGVAA